jgi:hypothetical protein
VDKHVWTVIGDAGLDASELTDRLLEELPTAMRELVPSTTQAHVTIQQADEFSQSLVDCNDASRPVDAAIELESTEECPPLDGFHAYLKEKWIHVQGWRVKPTLIYDSTELRGLQEPSRSPSVLIFVERLDGTTKDHFDRNWYIHAGHSDGCEAESAASLAERHREEAEASNRLYRQNRVVEPVTASAWHIDGYTQLQLGFFLPEIGDDPYPRVRGEEAFDRWPPRILQGFEYRIL